MRRVLLTASLVCAALAFASQAAANTIVNVRATFTEGVPQQFGCTVENGFSGTGEVVPFGQATETIQFGAGCGGTCDLRTITLAQGTLILEESFSPPAIAMA